MLVLAAWGEALASSSASATRCHGKEGGGLRMTEDWAQLRAQGRARARARGAAGRRSGGAHRFPERGGEVEGRVAIGVGARRVGAVAEEQLRRLFAPVAHRPVQGGAPLGEGGVDVEPRLEQAAQLRQLAVDRRGAEGALRVRLGGDQILAHPPVCSAERVIPVAHLGLCRCLECGGHSAVVLRLR